MVPHRYRDGRVIAFDKDVDRAALTMFDRIDKQVAQDALDPTCVHLSLAWLAGVNLYLRACRFREPRVRVDHPKHQITQVNLLRRQHGHAGVEPRNLQQVGQQRFESVRSVCNSSADRAVTGSKSSRASCRTSAAILTVVSGVRSSCETSETNCC